MFWSDTVARIAKMVESHSIWDGANKLGICPSMGTNILVVDGKDTVASHIGSGINPTFPKFWKFSGRVASLFYTPPKSFFRCGQLMIGITVAIMSGIVLQAKSQFCDWFIADTTKSTVCVIRPSPATSHRVAMALPPRIVSGTPSTTMDRFRTIINSTNHNMPPVASVTKHYTTLAKEW
jgi:hypothetical protein